MRKATTLVLVSVLVSAFAFAQSSDIPVRNWTVPPYTLSSSGSGYTTMADVSPPRAFIGVQPCRLVDTRAAAGFPAGYGAPALSPGVPRSFDLNDGPCPGLPSVVRAYSLNVTVVIPAGPGHLTVWPFGLPQPNVSSINYVAGQTIANAVIVAAGENGAITVLAGVSGTHLLIDINGYFSEDTTFDQSFYVVNDNSGFPTAVFANNSAGSCGLAGCAVHATSGTTSSGKAIGGFVGQGGNDSAGVLGVHGGFFTLPSYSGAGVRGHGPLYGVLGLSLSEGVTGSVLNNSGGELAYGILGSAVGVDTAGPPWGVFAGGNIGATGTKHFLDPHPGDPNLTIAYVSLEGPEAGTYFRGRSKFQNGIARIPVPEHFRLVTDPEGLTVQVTAIGEMATFAVVRMDLDEIVVKASRNVEFSYLVQGVRASFKDLEPIRRGGEFRPRSADARMPEWLSPAQKRVLVRNGTYREDGTVNRETAERLGWDRIWREREAPAAAPASD